MAFGRHHSPLYNRLPLTCGFSFFAHKYKIAKYLWLRLSEKLKSAHISNILSQRKFLFLFFKKNGQILPFYPKKAKGIYVFFFLNTFLVGPIYVESENLIFDSMSLLLPNILSQNDEKLYFRRGNYIFVCYTSPNFLEIKDLYFLRQSLS